MEGPKPYQTTRERFNDDPAVLMGLPPLEKISEFWKRYDHLADIHDKKMTSNLNGNLDVLLIFAALFSAINTAFISLSMPGLSSNASDETNALLRLIVMRADNNTLSPTDLSPPFSPSSNSVIVNCLLYASLSCSLLAAVGAMMAKEWLQSFDRTGQTGPLEEQGRFRQNKFNGVQQWHLESVVKFLPNLLLLSVILFFVGIGLFLVPINTAVAGTIIAFSGLGVLLSSITIFAGAVSPLCPYQSASSHAIRRMAKFFLRAWPSVWSTWAHLRLMLGPLKFFAPLHGLWIRFWRKVRSLVNENSNIRELRVVRFPLALISGLGGFIRRVPRLFGRMGHQSVGWVRAAFPSWVPRYHRLLTSWGRERRQALALAEDSALAVTVQAADWLLETTSNRGDQIAVAQFICALDGAACASAFEESGILRTLVPLTREALDVWHSQPSARNQEVAELFGLALCHTFLHSPKDGAKWSDVADLQSHQASSFSGTFLRALELVRNEYSPLSPEGEEYMLHICFLSAMIGSRQIVLEYEWAKLSDWNAKAHRMSDALLGLWAVVVFHIGMKSSELLEYGYRHTLDTLIKMGEDQQELANHLAWAVLWSPEALSSTKANSNFELNAAEIYTMCLQKTQVLVHQCTDGDLDRLTRGTAFLILHYLDSLTVSGPGDARLVKLASETVLTLWTLLAKDSSAARILQPSQLLNGVWMDAVVDLLLKDLEPLAESVKRCIIRILLWVWQNRTDTEIDYEGREAIFVSSCRLWAPLEEQVASSKTGTFGADDKYLTTDDLNRIVEFIEYVQKQENRKTFDFIARNADVGINRLYVHLDRRIDWNYQLYNFREQPTYCSRLTYIEDGML